MNNCTALVPLVDETAEFRKFERQTDARRAAEARQRQEVEAHLSEAERRRRWGNTDERKKGATRTAPMIPHRAALRKRNFRRLNQ